MLWNTKVMLCYRAGDLIKSVGSSWALVSLSAPPLAMFKQTDLQNMKKIGDFISRSGKPPPNRRRPGRFLIRWPNYLSFSPSDAMDQLPLLYYYCALCMSEPLSIPHLTHFSSLCLSSVLTATTVTKLMGWNVDRVVRGSRLQIHLLLRSNLSWIMPTLHHITADTEPKNSQQSSLSVTFQSCRWDNFSYQNTCWQSLKWTPVPHWLLGDLNENIGQALLGRGGWGVAVKHSGSANEQMSQLLSHFQRKGCHKQKDTVRHGEAFGKFPKRCRHIQLKADLVVRWKKKLPIFTYRIA